MQNGAQNKFSLFTILSLRGIKKDAAKWDFGYIFNRPSQKNPTKWLLAKDKNTR